MASAAITPKPVTARLQWTVLVLLVISVCINYIDRGNLSVASVDLKDALHLDALQLGYLLSAFFWTYAGFMVLAGWLVEKYNVIWVYAIGYFLWSCATAFTGLTNTFVMLFVLRLLLGMSESVAYPSYSKIIASGFPERQRGVANGLIDAGSKLGPALGMMIGGTILAHWGWRSLFLSVGAVSLLWLIPWCAIAPQVRTHELGTKLPRPQLRPNPAQARRLGVVPVPVRRQLRLVFHAHLDPRLPPHGAPLHHRNDGAGRVASVLGGSGRSGPGRLAVRPLDSCRRLLTRVRKTFVASGLCLSSALLPSAIAANQILAMTLLMAATFAYGFFSSNHWAITQTLAGPEAAGKWTGLQNCAGNMAGVAAPLITGWIVKETGSFYFAFIAVCLNLLLAACSYLFFIGRIQTHRWSSNTFVE